MGDEINVKSFDKLQPVSFTKTTAFDEWQRFRKKFQFILDSLPKKTPNKRKIGLFMTYAGDEALDIYETLDLSEDSSFDDVLQAFDDYVKLQTNTVFERNIFLKLSQKVGQTVDSYVLELKKQASKCDFHPEEKDKLIRDRLVLGIRNVRLQKELLRDAQLDLDKAVSMCKIWEKSQQEVGAINKDSSSSSSQSSFSLTPLRHTTVGSNIQSPPSSGTFTCIRCGYQHSRTAPCPAKDQTCNYCQKLGHFASVCRKRLSKPKSGNPTAKKADSTEAEIATDDLQVLHICSVNRQQGKKRSSR